jgi:hypothetical protein
MNEFDEKIGKAQINLESTLSEMKDLKESFILSAAEFLKPFWEEKAREIVKGEPEFLKELGNEKVSELRQEVKKLEVNTAKIVKSHLNAGKIWWHLDQSIGYRSTSYYDSFEFVSDPPSEQDNALRLAAGELAKLFEKYGFFSQKHHHERTNMWRSLYKKGGKGVLPSNKLPFYPSIWSWTKKMASIMYKYENLREKVQAIQETIKELKKEKQENEADNLWDKA